MKMPNPSTSFEVNDIDARLRIIEGKYNITRERLLSMNQNTIDHYKDLTSDIKLINDDLKDIKDELVNLKKTMKIFMKELNLFARKDNVKVLEKYIKMWNPLNFVTEEEVIELIKKNKIKNGTRTE